MLVGSNVVVGRDGEYDDYGTDEYDDEAQEVADQLYKFSDGLNIHVLAGWCQSE